MRGFIPVLIAGVVAVPHAVGAQVPPVVGFDGVLFTSEQCCGFSYEGPVTFRLCDVPEGACVLGGGPAWEETHEAGVVDGGYLHADLGAQVALPPAAFAGPRWLEVELSEGIGVLSPRVALTAVPYAWQCLDASTLGGKAAGDFSPASHAHPWSSVTDLPATLADGKVSWDEVVGPPPTFPPAGHVHVIPEVTGLQAALDGKAAAGHDHDGRYYPKHEVDVLLAGKEDVGTCYTTAQVDERIAGLVATDDARLLSADQKAQLTSGGVTALHSHPASPLEYNTLVNAMNLTKLSAATAKPIEGYRNFLYETFSSNTASETSNLWYDSTNKCYRPFDCSRYFVDLEANTLDPTKFAYGTLWVAPRPDAWRVYPPDGDTYETGRARVLAALFDGTGGSALTWPNAKQVTGIWTSEPRDVGRRAYRLRLRVAGTSVPGGANPSIAATGLFDGTTANPGVSSWVGLSKTANHYASLRCQCRRRSTA